MYNNVEKSLPQLRDLNPRFFAICQGTVSSQLFKLSSVSTASARNARFKSQLGQTSLERAFYG